MLKFFEKLKGFVWDKMSDDSANILLYSNVLGYFSSMIAQSYIIKTNNELSKKDKNYMLPQEIAEGCTNVLISLGLGKLVKNMGDSYLEQGKEEIEGARDIFEKMGLETRGKSFENIVKKMSKMLIENGLNNFQINLKNQNKPLSFILENLMAYYKVNKNPLAAKVSSIKNDFTKIKSGMGFLTTFATALLVYCFISPIIRNQIAGKFAQYAQNKEQEQTVKMLQYCAPIYAKKVNFTALNPLSGNPLG